MNTELLAFFQLDKPGKGSFYATDLDLLLRVRGITHLVITE